MSMLGRIFMRLADWLGTYAEHCAPTHRRDWAKAMRAELAHIDSPARALQWACGAIFACYIEGLKIMFNPHARPSKFILASEALIGFLPLTLLWVVAIVKINWLLANPNLIISMALATIAPIALVVSVHGLASGQLHHKAFRALALGFTIFGILYVLGMFIARPNKALFWFAFEWRLILLFSILPALCCLHFASFSKTSNTRDNAPRLSN